MKRRERWYWRLALLVILVAVVAACGTYNDDRGIGDAPVGERHEDPREVWQNIDGYPNVSAFCVHSHLVITNTRDADAVDVVPKAPECQR